MTCPPLFASSCLCIGPSFQDRARRNLWKVCSGRSQRRMQFMYELYALRCTLYIRRIYKCIPYSDGNSSSSSNSSSGPIGRVAARLFCAQCARAQASPRCCRRSSSRGYNYLIVRKPTSSRFILYIGPQERARARERERERERERRLFCFFIAGAEVASVLIAEPISGISRSWLYLFLLVFFLLYRLQPSYSFLCANVGYSPMLRPYTFISFLFHMPTRR